MWNPERASATVDLDRSVHTYPPSLPRALPNALHRARYIDFWGIFVVCSGFWGGQGIGISRSRTNRWESQHTSILCIGWVQMQRIFLAYTCSLGCQEHTHAHILLVFSHQLAGTFTGFCLHFIHIFIPQSMSDQGDFLLLHLVSVHGTVYLVARYQDVWVKYVPPR